MKTRFLGILLFLILSLQQLLASAPVVLSDHHDVHDVRGFYIDFLEDPTHKLTIQDVIKDPYTGKFRSGSKLEVLLNDNYRSTYWIRIKVINNSKTKSNWVAELYDFRIENVDVYTHHTSGVKFISSGGANYPFAKKDFKHKNFIYNLQLNSMDTVVLYYKIRADKQVSLIGRIRSYEKLLEYSNTEYFCLALFYGIILAMIFYNFFLFLALRHVNYLYYVLYVASVGIYLLNNDGLGFQFIWPRHPDWNDYIFPIANFSMTFWALLYGKSFLSKTGKSGEWISWGFIFFIALKTIYFIAWFLYPAIINNLWIDIIPFLYIYAAGIYSLAHGNQMARFYVLAFTLFFAGFIFSILRHFQLIADNVLTVYSFNLGFLSEMVLLSFALADRIKMISKEKEMGLENTVSETHHELQKKNKELDNFVYRSSHDIKGPIKSVIGLATLGMTENNQEISRDYFQHILKSSRKLDDIVNQLLSVIEIKETRITITQVDLQQVLSRVLTRIQKLPVAEQVKVYVHYEEGPEYFCDRTILYAILENMLEYVIHNFDPNKERSIVRVKFRISAEQLKIEITDNGLGKEQPVLENMVDILHKYEAGTHHPGLALYKARIFVEKLGGGILFRNKPGSGTLIHITLKNWLASEETTHPSKKKNKAIG